MQVDLSDRDQLNKLAAACFECMIDHPEQNHGHIVARVHGGKITSPDDPAGADVLIMRLASSAVTPPSLPFNLQAVAVNCAPGGEVVTSSGLGFAFLEALRCSRGSHARLSMSKCTEMDDDESAGNVWMHDLAC